MEPRVLYEDADLLVLVKPVGMPSQPDPSGAESVMDWASRRWPRPALHLPQRLDRPSGGVMVLARGPAAARELFRQFREREVEKSYLALVENGAALPASAGRLEHHLVHRARANRSIAHDGPAPGSRPAILEYRVVATGRTRTLLAIRLLTGRHHQVRAQLAHAGCPLVGDVKYGASRPLREGGVALFASHLELRHPRTGEPLAFDATPAGRAWEPFLSGELRGSLKVEGDLADLL